MVALNRQSAGPTVAFSKHAEPSGWPELCQQSEDRAAAMDCKSTDTNSLDANLANWLSLSPARSKKRPFVHSAGLGWQTDARRRAAIRSIAVVAAQGLAIKAVHRASAASSRW